MVSVCTPNQRAIEEMTRLLFTRTGASSWRKDSVEFNAFVHLQPAEGIAEAFLEKTGNVSCPSQYSARFTVAYVYDVDSAIIRCAKHLVSLLDEHHKSGTLTLYPALPPPASSTLLATMS